MRKRKKKVSAFMYKQDKATTEKHARILRELVKRPENKTCADCKRQDARWASWNIGVFICIRCSGIHRSMGTHVSKVKSVDLDTWTPEQMESIQKWGNHRANLYWEAHLRPGHVPLEHKLESFIRSKYESRRWAREGPPPDDPSTLETSEIVHTAPESSTSPIPAPASPPSSSAPPAITSRQPQPHRLLSATLANRASAPQAAMAPVIAQEAKPPEENDLFSLDFHAPAPSTNHQQAEPPRKDVKNDILSLFSAPSSTPAAAPTPNSLTGQWGQVTPAAHAQSQSISMMGTTGTAMWGAQSGWTPAAPSAQSDLWGGLQNASPAVSQQSNTQNLFETQSVWSSANDTTAGTSHGLNGAALTNTKKDDVFGDIWGNFK